MPLERFSRFLNQIILERSSKVNTMIQKFSEDCKANINRQLYRRLLRGRNWRPGSGSMGMISAAQPLCSTPT